MNRTLRSLWPVIRLFWLLRRYVVFRQQGSKSFESTKGKKRSPKWTSIYVLINPQDESWIYFKPSWHSILPPSVIATHCPVRWQLPRSTIWMFTIISKHKSGPASRLFTSFTSSQIRSRWQLWGPFTSFLCFALTLTRSVLGKSWTQ